MADLDVAQNVFFGLLAVAAVVGALRVVTTTNVVHAALWLVLVLAAVGANFLLLGAEFVGITQVLVYIGAIVVLFLFGTMLTRAPMGRDPTVDNVRSLRVGGAVIAVGLFALLAVVLIDGFEDTEVLDERVALVSPEVVLLVKDLDLPSEPDDVVGLRADDLRDHLAGLDDDDLDDGERRRLAASIDRVAPELANQGSNTAAVSDSIFSQYLVPFEAVGLLLTAALIGAIVLARKE